MGSQALLLWRQHLLFSGSILFLEEAAVVPARGGVLLRGMPLNVVIAPAEDCFWPDLQDTDMRLKIRVRRMKEGRELRGVYAPAGGEVCG